MLAFVLAQRVTASTRSRGEKCCGPWQVEIQESEKLHRLGVEPDRVFGLRFAGEPEQRRRAYSFLEADRGTMPITRNGLAQTSFRRKLLGCREMA
jgi:hypothetical protein